MTVRGRPRRGATGSFVDGHDGRAVRQPEGAAVGTVSARALHLLDTPDRLGANWSKTAVDW